MVQAIRGREVVVQCCERAVQAGVRPRMTLAHARALLTGCEVLIHPHEPQRDAGALRALARWMMRFSPLVAADLPDGLILDVTGCERLHRGEGRLVNTIANSLDWLGFRARVACAGSIGCACAVARFAPSDRSVIEIGDERAALDPLSIEAMRLDDETLEGLREVGIEQIVDLFELPRLELAVRFGSDLLLRMDQAMGEAMEVIEPVRPSEMPCVSCEFDGPTRQLEAITQAVRDLLMQMADRLRRRELGARTLYLTADRIDAEPVRESITLSRPSRNIRHLWMLLQPKVEVMHLGYGVERLSLTAPQTGRLRHEQLQHMDGDDPGGLQQDAAFGEFLDTLCHRLPSDRVLHATPRESHVPERAFCREPLRTTQSVQRRVDVQTIAVERPSMLLSNPEMIDVMAVSPEGPPVWLRWRGDEHRIVNSAGPERIVGEWWRPPHVSGRSSTRDYFRVQEESGRWLWICHVLESGRWYVHGEWA